MSKKIKNSQSNLIADQGKVNLMTGIEEEAKSEASILIENAEKSKHERQAWRDSQVTSILESARQKAAVQVELSRKSAASLISVESKRLDLKVRDAAIKRSFELTEKKMLSLINSKEYPDFLKKWIIEAIIGLSASDGEVNASKDEKKIITDRMLRDIEADVKRISGIVVRLSMSKENPIASQGIVVNSTDKRTAFNNQIYTRLLRSQFEIRKLIYKELFGE